MAVQEGLTNEDNAKLHFQEFEAFDKKPTKSLVGIGMLPSANIQSF